MTQLFQHKWVSTEGEYSDNGKHTGNFLRWAHELKHFDDDAWKRAYSRIECDIKESAKLGEQAWPPSSVAVVAFAEKPVSSAMYKPFDRSRAIEDKTARERRMRVGQEHCKKLMAMFDDAADDTEGVSA